MLMQLFGGVLLGLAGSLHCAAMCGGIGSGAALMLAPQTKGQLLRTVLLLSAGRISVYALLGGIIALSVELASQLVTVDASGFPMQWIGAAALIGVGFSTAGLLPAFAVGSQGSGRLFAIADRAIAPIRRRPALAPFGLGVLWGATPCPLVYAALFTAALTGTLTGSVVWMIGFGLGTLPAIVLAMLGLTWLSRFNVRAPVKMAVGLSIALFAVAALYWKLPVFPGLCT